MILEGKNLKKAAVGSSLVMCVQAAARHASQAGVDIPYALAVTLEVAQSARTSLYTEVRDTIRARTSVRTTIRT